MRPSERQIRVVAALIVAAGVAAAGLAVLAEELGVGAEAARGTFGWKRIALLAAGLVVMAAGAVLMARPGLTPRIVDLESRDPADREVRIAAALVVAAGVGASFVALLSTELGLGAAEGTFGWKQTLLLAVGVLVAVIGALLLVRPRMASRPLERWVPESPLPSDRHLGQLAIGLLALLGVVLVWTRIAHIDGSLWHDEVFTVVQYSGVGPGAILFSDFDFNNHALYNLLSWLTATLFGESDAMYRLWGVVPGIAAIGVGAWWTWGRIGPAASVAFATIAVAGPLHLEYTTQARGYGLALLAAVLLLVAADRLTWAYSRRALIAFVGAGLLGIWTLVIFAIAFVGQAIALLRWRELRLPVVVAVGAAGVLSIAFYAPGVGDMAGSGVSGATIPLLAALVLDRPLEWMVIPTVTMLTGDGPRPPLDGSGVGGTPGVLWLDVVALALLVLGLVALWRRGKGGLALSLLVPPLFFNLVLSLGEMATVTRHQLFLLPYVVILVAAGIDELGRLAARYAVTKAVAVAVGVAAVVVFSGAIVERSENTALPRENFKQVAEVVERTGIETVVTDSGQPEGLRYYLGDDLAVVPTDWAEEMLCEPRSELVYIDHLRASHPYWSPEGLDCLSGDATTRIRVLQRERGSAIDVWVIDPRVTAEIIEDDLGYAREP